MPGRFHGRLSAPRAWKCPTVEARPARIAFLVAESLEICRAKFLNVGLAEAHFTGADLTSARSGGQRPGRRYF